MTVGEHKAVAIGPLRVAGVMPQKPVPKDLGDIRHAHGRAGMAAVGRLNGIHGESTNGISQFSLRGHNNSGGHEASAIVCEAAPMGKFPRK